MDVKEAWENNLIKINRKFKCKYQNIEYDVKLVTTEGEWLFNEVGENLEIFLLDVDCGVILCDIDDAYIFEIIKKEG